MVGRFVEDLTSSAAGASGHEAPGFQVLAVGKLAQLEQVQVDHLAEQRLLVVGQVRANPVAAGLGL
jgi:hypothetical protein